MLQPRRDGFRPYWTPTATARSLNGPSRINRSIPRRTTGSNSGATGLPSTQSMGACGARESASRIPRSCASSEGPTPPQSSKAEVYVPPADKMPLPGSGGVAIDSNGVVWQNWRGAHQMMSFDRRKCKVLNGPEATGQHCPEGWTVYKTPGPTFQGAPDYASPDMLYMTEVDRDNTLGLGKDVVLSGDVNADSFFVLMPQGGQMTTLTLRVPYPL